MWPYLERKLHGCNQVKMTSYWTRMIPNLITGIFTRRKSAHSPRDAEMDTLGEHCRTEAENSFFVAAKYCQPPPPEETHTEQILSQNLQKEPTLPTSLLRIRTFQKCEGNKCVVLSPPVGRTLLQESWKLIHANHAYLVTGLWLLSCSSPKAEGYSRDHTAQWV